MKLRDLFIGKLVKGIKGKVLPVQEQENPNEPIGYIKSFEVFNGEIHPFIHWIGTDSDLDHGVHPENITDLEE